MVKGDCLLLLLGGGGQASVGASCGVAQGLDASIRSVVVGLFVRGGAGARRGGTEEGGQGGLGDLGTVEDVLTDRGESDRGASDTVVGCSRSTSA